jgi:hypothetical protein
MTTTTQERPGHAEATVRSFIEQAAGRLVLAGLPGSCVCAAVRHEGSLFLVVDLDKPGAWTLAEDMLPDIR